MYRFMNLLAGNSESEARGLPRFPADQDGNTSIAQAEITFEHLLIFDSPGKPESSWE